MDVQQREVEARGIKFTVSADGHEVGRAYLYLMSNDLHEQPFGLLEDVYVKESHRRHGIGTRLVEAVVAEAKKRGCYKLIATSRHTRSEVHTLYEKLGWKDHGKEFRIDF